MDENENLNEYALYDNEKQESIKKAKEFYEIIKNKNIKYIVCENLNDGTSEKGAKIQEIKAKLTENKKEKQAELDNLALQFYEKYGEDLLDYIILDDTI